MDTPVRRRGIEDICFSQSRHINAGCIAETINAFLNMWVVLEGFKIHVESIVIVLPLVDAMVEQILHLFTLIVGCNHGMWWRDACTESHAMARDTTQEIKNISLGHGF